MNETNVTKEIGEIVSDFKFSHEYLGEKFYKTDLTVKRESGNIDIIPIMVSERSFNVHYSLECKLVKVTGSIRTFNDHSKNNHLILYLYAEDIVEVTEDEVIQSDNNLVTITGFICKKTKSRSTPFGRVITDAIIAVNRQYHKSDYIPVIFWSKNAKYLDQLDIGTQIKIIGRFQSREYLKNGDINVTYEISVQSLEVLSVETI